MPHLAAAARDGSFRAFKRELARLDSAGALPFEPSWRRDVRAAQRAAERRSRSLLRGKRVVIVGPADYAAGAGKGPMIESFDLVARVNFQWPVPPELAADFGTRMDILYHCCNGDYPVELLARPGFENTLFACVEHNLQSLRLKNCCRSRGVLVFYYPQRLYRRLSARLGFPPSTGLAAVQHLLSLPIRELLIYGMTFLTTPYYPGYTGDAARGGHWGAGVPESIWQHNPRAELHYIRRLLRHDRRATLDPRAAALTSAY